VAASTDFMVGVVAGGTSYREPATALASLAAAAGVAFVAYLALRALVGLALRRRTDATAQSATAGFFVATLFAIVRIDALEATPPAVLDATIALAVAATVAACGYMAAERARATGARAPARAARALPALALIATAHAWIGFVGIGDVTSMRFALASAAALVVGVGVFLLAWTAPSRRAQWSVVVVLVAVVAAGSAGMLRVIAASPRHDTAGVGHGVGHVVLITVDTLRRDVLSCYGSETVRTPNIDSIARDGCLFENAVSPSSWPLPAFAAMMTGLPTSVHGATRTNSVIPPGTRTLAEHFRDAGYQTQAFVTNAVLAAHRGIARGFAEYALSHSAWRAPSLGETVVEALTPSPLPRQATPAQLTDAAVAWVDAHRGDDFFLWVHYLDPHLPYEPPANLIEGGAHADLGTVLPVDSDTRTSMSTFGNPERRAWARALYDGEVRWVDMQIGRLLAALREGGMYEDALVVFGSDHGEEFWDHDGFEHGHTLYGELVDMPLIVKAPRARSGVRLDAHVTTADVMPTMLDLCSIPFDSTEFSVSMSPFLDGTVQPPGGRTLYSAGTLFASEREAIVFEGVKYIRSLVTGREELYDLRSDRKELRSLVAVDATLLERARALMEEHLARAEAYCRDHGVTRTTVEMDPRELQQLRALGYL
jgi:arylsulfatase A-like enzyme